MQILFLGFKAATFNNEKALGWQSICGGDGNQSGGKPSKRLCLVVPQESDPYHVNCTASAGSHCSRNS